MTEEIVAFINKQLGQDLTPIFDQYLRRAELPVLEVTFDETGQLAWYRWNAAERGFAMPIQVGDPAKWQTIQPSADWKSMPWTGGAGGVQGGDRALLRRREDPGG